MSFLFTTKQFYGDKLMLSIGIFASSEILIGVLSRGLREISGITYVEIVIIGNIMCFISAVATVSLPYLDFEKQSIFTVIVKDRAKDEYDHGSWPNWFGIPFIIPHIVLVFCLTVSFGFLDILTTQWQYLHSWHSNAVKMQVFIRAISLPAIGSIFDTYRGRLSGVPMTIGRTLYSIVNYYYLALIFLFGGIFGVTIMSILLVYYQIPIFQSLLVVTGFQGFFLASIQMTLYFFPIIFVKNGDFDSPALKYPAYMNLVYFMVACGDFVRFWIYSDSYLPLRVNLVFGFLIGSMNIVAMLIYTPLLIISLIYFSYEKRKWIQSQLSKLNQTLLKENSHKLNSYRNYPRLLYLVPIEAFVLLIALTILFIISGGLNILLHSLYSTQSTRNIPNVIFLPILFLFTLISGYFTFPNELLQLIRAAFFQQSMKILFGPYGVSIGMLLSSNPGFCMAHESLKLKEKLYSSLFDSTSVKRVLVVIPDEVVLFNEKERYTIIDLENSLNEFRDIEKLGEQIECSNGIIFVNVLNLKKLNLLRISKDEIEEIEDSEFRDKFLNASVFYRYFHMFVYIGYFGFFLIPLIYKLILKATCIGDTCLDIVIFENSIFAIILAINFVFGFFLVIPFIEIYRELCKNLQQTMHQTAFLKRTVSLNFACKTKHDFESVTTSKLKILDIQINHCQMMINAKSEHLKYTMIFAMGLSKLFSVTFSLFALFVKGIISVDVVSIVYLIIVIELVIARFIILPASVISSEFKVLLMTSITKEKAFRQHIYSGNIDSNARMVCHYWRALHLPWEPLITIGDIGFNLRVGFISTNFWFSSNTMQTWLFTFLLTTIPSVITYFVKQYV